MMAAKTKEVEGLGGPGEVTEQKEDRARPRAMHVGPSMTETCARLCVCIRVPECVSVCACVFMCGSCATLHAHVYMHVHMLVCFCVYMCADMSVCACVSVCACLFLDTSQAPMPSDAGVQMSHPTPELELEPLSPSLCQSLCQCRSPLLPGSGTGTGSANTSSPTSPGLLRPESVWNMHGTWMSLNVSIRKRMFPDPVGSS